MVFLLLDVRNGWIKYDSFFEKEIFGDPAVSIMVYFAALFMRLFPGIKMIYCIVRMLTGIMPGLRFLYVSLPAIFRGVF